MYLFSAIGALGIGCASRNVLVLALVMVFFLLYYPAVISHEERVLARMHGESFRAYAERVPRFLPRLSLYREPEEYVVRMPVYRQTFFDALGFMWAYMGLEVMIWVRALGYLPWLGWNP